MIKVGKIIDKATFVVSIVSYCGIIAIMLLNVADVLMNKLFGNPIKGTYEITEVLLLCTVIGSFAYAQTKKAHINMTLLIKVFPRFLRFFVYGLMGLLSTGTAAVVGYAAILQAASAIDKGTITSVLFIPMYPFYYIEAAAMFVFALALLYDTALSFIAVFSKKYEELVVSTWNEADG
jgi:TRAP-type C4-dicarboxylate transport system permease small subunit